MQLTETNFSAGVEMPVTLVGETFESPAVDTTPETVSETVKVVNRLRDLKTSARDQLMIDPRIILVDDGHNPRNYDLSENRAHLDELKKSIAEMGVLIPLLVRYDAERKAAVLIDGECRLRATLELIAEGVEIATVPTIQVSGGNERDRLLVAITANTGKPLSKWELGAAFTKLYNFGWSEEQIAKKTGYAARFVSESIELADAPDEIKQLLSSQAVTPSLALAELRANGAAAVETLKQAAQAAQSSGKKGPAKRAKAQPNTLNHSKPAAPSTPAPAPARPSAPLLPANVSMAIMALADGIPAEDLNDVDGEVVIKVSKLLKVLSFALTADDLKAVGVK